MTSLHSNLFNCFSDTKELFACLFLICALPVFECIEWLKVASQWWELAGEYGAEGFRDEFLCSSSGRLNGLTMLNEHNALSQHFHGGNLRDKQKLLEWKGRSVELPAESSLYGKHTGKTPNHTVLMDMSGSTTYQAPNLLTNSPGQKRRH